MYTKQTPDIAARRWRLVKPSFNRCQACEWLRVSQQYTVPHVDAVPDVAGGCCANGTSKGLELEERNSYEEILPNPGRRRGACGFDGGSAGTGHGPTLARPQAGLPRHRQEESGVAARSPQGVCRADKALPPLVTVRQRAVRLEEWSPKVGHRQVSALSLAPITSLISSNAYDKSRKARSPCRGPFLLKFPTS